MGNVQSDNKNKEKTNGKKFKEKKLDDNNNESENEISNRWKMKIQQGRSEFLERAMSILEGLKALLTIEKKLLKDNKNFGVSSKYNQNYCRIIR